MPMYSTPAMVGHFEGICLKMLIPFQDSGETSVGYKVERQAHGADADRA